MKTVFIDGSAGTTGLRIRDRIAARADLSLYTLSEDERKDTAARARAINTADIVFLCLPDDAAREAVALCENPDTVILDASTAHRTDPRFAYGFPELSDDHAARVRASRRIAVPGCHASGFIALIYPLVRAGVLSPDTLLTCFSLTGFSGGGKKMIAQYEQTPRDALLDAPRQYALSQQHKHLPEMRAMTGVTRDPVFCPIVADFYSGMELTVPLHAGQLSGGIEAVRRVYQAAYPKTGVVHYNTSADEGGFASAAAYSGRDDMEISVHGNAERVLLVARYDNLGKGASGAAVECMNIALGCDPAAGLVI